MGKTCRNHFHYLCLPKIKVEKVIGSLTLELYQWKGDFASSFLKLLLYYHVSSCEVFHYLGPIIKSSVPLTPMVYCKNVLIL